MYGHICGCMITISRLVILLKRFFEKTRIVLIWGMKLHQERRHVTQSFSQPRYLGADIPFFERGTLIRA